MGKSGEYLFIDKDEETAKLSKIFYRPTLEQQGYVIYLDEYERPYRVVIEDHAFALGKYQGTQLNITVMYPSGETELVRNIDTGVNWNGFAQKSISNTDERTWRDEVKIAYKVTSAVGCTVGIASTISSSGFGFALAVVGCESALLSHMIDRSEEELPNIKKTNDAVGAAVTLTGCALTAGIGCLLDLIAQADNIIDFGIGVYNEFLRLALNGLWIRGDGLIVNIDAPDATFYEFGSFWQQMADERFIYRGDNIFKNIIPLNGSTRVWSCESLWTHFRDGEPVLTLFGFSRIVLGDDGESIIMTCYDPIETWDIERYTFNRYYEDSKNTMKNKKSLVPPLVSDGYYQQ